MTTDIFLHAPTPPPAGAEFVGEWDLQFDDRFFRFAPTSVEDVAAYLSGVQNRDATTATNVVLRLGGAVIVNGKSVDVAADLTPAQARELGRILTDLAERCHALDLSK
ncbi:MAG: hypothetical protein ACOYB7_02475 [Mycobacterium sp.]